MAARRTDIPRDRATYERMYVAEGLSIRQIAKLLEVSAALVKKDLHQHGITMRSDGLQKHVALAARTEEAYRELYINRGLSLRDIGRELGISFNTVHQDMQRLGIERRDISAHVDADRRERVGDDQRASVVPRIQSYDDPPDRSEHNSVKYKDLNTRYFECIDNEAKAYALGLIWTDGSVSHDRVRIKLQEGDRDALEAIRAAMGAAPLEWHAPQPGVGKTPMVSLRICSRHLCADLGRLGLCEDKCAVLPGRVVKPPPEFMLDFVRGMMDGDGSLNRPTYPTIVFYNMNPALRAIVAECWETITGKRSPTYVSYSDGKERARVCEIGERAVAIARALYLERSETFSFVRKRLRAEEFQKWRRRTG